MSAARTAAVDGDRSPRPGVAAIPRIFLLFVISPRERVQRAVGWCVETCNHIPAPSDLPSQGRESGVPDEGCNTALVDPRKASKGRRMSKKSRKKSSKTPSGSPTAKKKVLKTRASSQTKPAKTRRAPASKSTASIAKTASHGAASKQLNSSKSPAAAKVALAEGEKAPPSACPATAAMRSRCPTMPAASSSCSSIPAPTRPAAPGGDRFHTAC